MSGLEVIGAVAAVVSAFHGGAELVAHIKKKHRRRSSKGQTQKDFEEKQLQDSLETGETEVGKRYTSDIKELGQLMRVGDAIARDRLLHIAIVMQAEIIKSLQIAVKYDNAILNLKILHEASILNRQDSLTTLTELKQRILITRPVPRTLQGAPEGQADMTQLNASVQSFQKAPLTPVPDSYIPSAVTIPAQTDTKESKSGLARYFSMKRNNSQSPTSSMPRPASDADSINFSPALNYLIQENGNRGSIMKDIDDIISAYQGLHTENDKRDTWAILNGGSYGGNSQRNTMALNREAIQMLRNLPATPEEAHGNSEYPAMHKNAFSPQSYNQYNPYFPRPQEPSGDARFSISSSVYSDAVPPSLYSQDSNDSHPHSRNHSRSSSTASPILPYAALQRPRTPPILPYAAAQRPQTPPTAPYVTPQRSQTPPTAPLALSQRPRTPAKDDRSPLNAGRTVIHFVPGHSSSSSLSSFSSANTNKPLPNPSQSSSTSMGAHNAFAPIPTNALPPPPPPPPPPPILTQFPTYASSSTSSSNPSLGIRTATIAGPSPTASEVMMSGRPCKSNNYWGFCKGAWAIREELKRGLGVSTRPDGMYNTHQIWQCKHCHFEGKTFTAITPGKKKKETVVDPNVHTSAVGIRYRWIFLAKSHVKKASMSSSNRGATAQVSKNSGNNGDCNFGCVICSVEGNVTGIYGNVETLMNHVFLEHARGMGEGVARKARCVVGRVAGPEEDWDLNIPETGML
ncbi:hypothetical protein P154DRAFT_569597 [Amniculicola lignicola CBS 123094]|uniref:Uncharacterized protein n=1 Tax=Amniculicola lignicola CBS 123094 TaxID=1392246 RepID=A0A6A5X1J0_9PLEO|nr:hypothetical protein P154DRAFT_569597 [Amniculicola lignicola CBS 123094]